MLVFPIMVLPKQTTTGILKIKKQSSDGLTSHALCHLSDVFQKNKKQDFVMKSFNSMLHVFAGQIGNGRLDAVSNAIKQYFGSRYELEVYEEHALTRGFFQSCRICRNWRSHMDVF